MHSQEKKKKRKILKRIGLLKFIGFVALQQIEIGKMNFCYASKSFKQYFDGERLKQNEKK